MTQEEKAKAYDEALDRARELYEKDSVFDSEKTLIICIFPELKDSEDEMIREEIVSYIQQAIDSGYGIISKERKEKWLAWLEKQSEHHIACPGRGEYLAR